MTTKRNTTNFMKGGNDMKKEMKGGYAKAVADKLHELDFHFGMHTRDHDTVFTLTMAADNAPGLNVKMIIDENGDSKLRSYLASDVPASKRPAVAAELNKLNSRYRYICLCIDDDGDVCATYDFAIFGDEEAACEHAISMMFLYADIVDKCIPPIMQTIWREDTRTEAAPETIKVSLFGDEGGEA